MKKYRMRYPTEREIGRLMGVSDKNIDTMLDSGLSHTKLCYMFGNSIVVQCMEHMFKNLFVEKPKKKDEVLW